ncbi:MAG: nuclear transport factor 2 family protein [Steroidobacteraceae bacterium]
MKRTFMSTCVAILLGGGGHAIAGETGDRAGDPLHSEMEIARLPVSYAWAVDGKNIDEIMDLFADDAVYDLSAYGYANVVGTTAIRELFIRSVFSAEQCSFSSISNVRVKIQGSRATGSDYFVHIGYNDRKLGESTRHYVEGQHFYEFVRLAGRWKISRMVGRPTFQAVEKFAPESLMHCGQRS